MRSWSEREAICDFVSVGCIFPTDHDRADIDITKVIAIRDYRTKEVQGADAHGKMLVLIDLVGPFEQAGDQAIGGRPIEPLVEMGCLEAGS